MTKKIKTSPRGRPTRRPGERLSKNRTFRVRSKLDDELAAAATLSERSVSEEIEFRLEKSFSDQRALLDGLNLLYGPELAATLLIIGDVSKEAALHAGYLKTKGISQNQWMVDPWVFAQMKDAAIAALDQLSPPGAVSAPQSDVTLIVGTPPTDLGSEPEQTGKTIARGYFRDLVDRNAEQSSHALMLQNMLGSKLLGRVETGVAS
jgi:hypothetical protein